MQGAAFLQDNACPLTAVHPPTTELPRRWNILPGTCDYHVFGTLKDTSTGRHFANGHRAKEATQADLVTYEVKFALQPAMKAHRRNKGIPLLFL